MNQYGIYNKQARRRITKKAKNAEWNDTQPEHEPKKNFYVADWSNLKVPTLKSLLCTANIIAKSTGLTPKRERKLTSKEDK